METKDKLAEALTQLNANILKLHSQNSLLQSFLRGILSGLGSVIGATLVVAILVFLLRNVNLVPVIGDWLSQITVHVIDNLSR